MESKHLFVIIDELAQTSSSTSPLFLLCACRFIFISFKTSFWRCVGNCLSRRLHPLISFSLV